MVNNTMNEKFTYQYLEIKNSSDIISDLQHYYLNNKIDYNQQFNGVQLANLTAKCKYFRQWIIDNKLRPTYAYYVVVKPGETSPLHIDAQENDLSVNFPIENCRENWTSMYEVHSPLVYRAVYPGGVKRHWYEWESSDPERTEICQCRVIAPLIFNTKIPHQVNNPTVSDRVTFIIRFKEDPWFLIKNEK
jgi:hypothetical protein